jgi:urea transport system ATP-binding protein
MLEIQGLNQFYGGSHTLWDVDMTVPTGSCTCLMGRNGMGKTTLLRCIMGVASGSSGKVLYEGRNLLTLPPEDRAHMRIGFVPQGREIFSQLTVEENLRIGLAAHKPKLRAIPEHLFDMFPVLRTMLRRRGGDLSGGQQQQLAIARALVLDPQLLILDEPTEGIQPNIVAAIGDVIQKLNRETKLTVLLVEQKLPFARRVATHLRVLDKGRLVVSGEIAALTDELVRAHLTV